MLPKRCAPVKLVRLVSRMYTGSQMARFFGREPVSIFEKRWFHFFLKRWFDSWTQFLKKQTWCSMAIFQCFKHVSDLWLLESWLVCDSNALCMFGPFSREMASLKAWKWARGFTRWTTNDWVVFIVFWKGEKTCFCCGWTSFVWEFCWGRWGSWKIDEWFVLRKWLVSPKTIMSAWKIWVLNQH